MKSDGHNFAPLELMSLANRAGALARETWQLPKQCRLVGRLARDPHDFGALCEAVVDGVKRGDSFFLELTTGPAGFTILQFSLEGASENLWEELWDNAHFDRIGEGEDFDLEAVWREKVRAMFRDCHRHYILAMTRENYFAKVIGDGATEEVAQRLTDWISEITTGDTPGLLE